MSVTFIIGPQGSGKTKKARELCEARGGTHVHSDASDLSVTFGLYRFLHGGEPDTVVCDEAMKHQIPIAVVKALATGDPIIVRQKHQQAFAMTKTPHVIICTSFMSEVPEELVRHVEVIKTTI